MIITIEGPTASGKSQLALSLAKSLGSCIISADSRQIYIGMDIGTAKASQEEQKAVPHHLIDIIHPNQSYSAGDFGKSAAQIIEVEHQQGRIPIVCGGSGLFVKTLLQGICQLPSFPESIKKELKEYLDSSPKQDGSYQQRLAELYAELSSVDPLFAKKVSSNDSQRIIRGLEVYRGTGIPLSQHWQAQNKEQPYQSFKILINPPRKLLYERINQRFSQMISRGLLDEISALLAQGFSFADPGLNSVGYKEFRAYFEEGISLEESVELAAQHSRNYAKRQLTWYRTHDFDLTTDGFSLSLSVITSKIKEFVQAKL